jgi:Predicted dehydrogenases and related proteins
MRLRGAIVGLGNVAVHGHLPAWLARGDVELVAATDTCSARKEVLERHLPAARWYHSLDALISSEALDFVDICTPPATHADSIRIALEYGLHVLCEKPTVARLKEFDALSARAEEADRVLFTVHNWLEAPIIQKVSELLRQGAIGDITACRWETLRTQPAVVAEARAGNWRLDPAIAGGGILVDHGWHALYVVHNWLGVPPGRVSARLETRRHTRWPIEDTATVRLEYPTANADIVLTWAAKARQNRAVLHGTGGILRIEDSSVVLIPADSKMCERRWNCPPALYHGSHHPDWFAGIASTFLGAITGASKARSENLAQARLCVTLINLAQASSRQGGISLTVEECCAAPTRYAAGGAG